MSISYMACYCRKPRPSSDWQRRILSTIGKKYENSRPPETGADAFGQGQSANLDHKPVCERGYCNGQLECNRIIGLPPATLVEFALQVDKSKPIFYDVSLVDGYNLPVSVDMKTGSRKCHIGGCSKNLKSMCPVELQVVNGEGEVVACKSACLAYNLDSFCCRNEYGSPEKCKPILYSKLFKDACPSYFSYAFDTPTSFD